MPTKQLLILGGTRFLGRVFLEKLLSRPELAQSYTITLCNRGKTNPELFPELRKIQADRETEQINLITGQDWDIILDFSGYYPSSFERMLAQLSGKVGRYIYVSTVSVYDLSKIGKAAPAVAEDFPLLECSTEEFKAHPDNGYKGMELYGKHKAACESVLTQQKGLESLIFRPAVVFGKYDYIDRHYYWIHRARNAEKILIPTPQYLANHTFVEDLAEVLIEALGIQKHQQIYNLTTQNPHTLADTVRLCAEYFHTRPELVLLDKNTLEKAGVNGGNKGVALWYPLDFCFSNSRLVQDFQHPLTPLTDSMHKTIAYYQQLYGQDWKTGTYGWTIAQESDFLKQF